jgi:hypothetical protein
MVKDSSRLGDQNASTASTSADKYLWQRAQL